MTIQELFEKLKSILTNVVPSVEAVSTHEQEEKTKAGDALLSTRTEKKEEKEDPRKYRHLPDLTEFFEQCYSLKRLESLINDLEYSNEEDVNLTKVLKPFEEFFAKRWERIKDSQETYLNFSSSSYFINKACVQMAEIMAPILRKPVCQLLMPTLPVADHTASLNRLLLSDDKTRAISVMGYCDRAVSVGAYPETDEFGQKLSEAEHKRLQHYDINFRDYILSIDDLVAFEKDKTAPVPIKSYVTTLVECVKQGESIDWFDAVYHRLDAKQIAELDAMTGPSLNECDYKTFRELLNAYRMGKVDGFFYVGESWSESPGPRYVHAWECLNYLTHYHLNTLFRMTIKVDSSELRDRTSLCLRAETIYWKKRVDREEEYMGRERYNAYKCHTNDHQFSERVFTEDVIDFLMTVVGNEEIAVLHEFYRKYLISVLFDDAKKKAELGNFVKSLFYLLRCIREDKRQVVIYWLGILPVIKLYGFCDILGVIPQEKREGCLRLLGRPVLWSVFSNPGLLQPTLLMLQPQRRKEFFEWLKLNEHLVLMIEKKQEKEFRSFMLNVFPSINDKVAIASQLPLTENTLLFMLAVLDKKEGEMIVEKLTDKQLKEIFVGKETLQNFGAKVVNELRFGLNVKINKSHLQCYMRAYRACLQEIIDSSKEVAALSFFKENAQLSLEDKEKVMRVRVRRKEAENAMAAVSVLIAEMQGIFIPGEFRKFMQNDLSKNFDYLRQIYDFYERLSQDSPSQVLSR